MREKDMSKKILVLGYYGFANSGDEAVLASICRDLQKKGEAYETTVLSNTPEATSESYKVRSISRNKLWDVFKEIKNADVFLVGGGSLLQDVSSSMSLYYYLVLMIVAHICRTKIMLYANGIGPVHKPLNQKLFKWVVNPVDTITLREAMSKVTLEKLKVDKPKIYVTSDPVFALEETQIDVQRILKAEGIETTKPLVAVCYRTWGNDQRYIKKTALLCDYMIEKYDVNVVFLPFKNPTDLEVSREIAKAMVHKSYELKEPYDVDTMIAIIGEMRFVVAMRLHALLYAAIKNVPMIGFVYDPKVAYYLEALKMFGVQDLNGFELGEVKNYVDQIMLETVTIKERLAVVTQVQKELAKKNVDFLLEVLNQSNK
jgi:polysaccharide pyruvyl transferase CsaB